MVEPDARVQDVRVMAEIELYGEIVIAASESDGPLTLDRIDEVLGVSREPDGQGRAAG